tara:strand:- start:2897 stop:3490 length:594 start_codon:yes stop_codon:yes gene_type:complete
MKKQIEISKIKENNNNPRFINKDKFNQLVKSIKKFPEMLEKRPLVVDENNIVLGGNMRLKALKKAGIKKVWIDVAKNWSEDQKKEFIIKDNLGYGEWDFDILANEWDLEQLDDWGLDVPYVEDEEDNEEPEIEFSEYLDESHNYVVLTFDNDIDWLSAQTHFQLKSVYSKRANGKPWSKGIGRVIDGGKYLNDLKDV